MKGIKKKSKAATKRGMIKFKQDIQRQQENKFPEDEQKLTSTSIIDQYHRLLETMANTLASASSNILHTIFHQILLNHLFQSTLVPDLGVYLYKMAEKILSIC